MRSNTTFVLEDLQNTLLFETATDTIDLSAMLPLLPQLLEEGKLSFDAFVNGQDADPMKALERYIEGCEYFLRDERPSRFTYLRRSIPTGYEWELFTFYGVGDDLAGEFMYDMGSLLLHPELAAAAGVTNIRVS